MKRSEFITFAQSTVKGNTFITVESNTDARLRKTGCPYVGVRKLAAMNGQIGFDYGDNVNALAAKEGKAERESKPRAWGELTPDRLFVCKDKGGPVTHLRMRVHKCLSRRFIDAAGNEVAPDAVAPFLPAKNKSSTQADLDGEVIERDILLENVKVVRMNGQEIVLED